MVRPVHYLWHKGWVDEGSVGDGWMRVANSKYESFEAAQERHEPSGKPEG
ncbi:MAG: hypothetical protein ACYS4W_08945 [Planctomycetota bacterium]